MIDAMVELLGWALIDAAWQGVIVGALYVGARALVRDARLRLAIGHFALLALALLPIASLVVRLNLPAALPGAATAASLSADSIGAVATAPSLWTIDLWLPWLVAAWAVGVAVHTVRLFAQWRGLRQLCAASAPADAEWLAMLGNLRRRMGVNAKVRLLHGAQVVTPMLVGVLRPTILLPTSLLLQLPRAQVELILTHELAHLHRLDTWFNLLQTCLDTLLFFHPAVRWISRKVREDRELCCDELVVAHGGDRFLYARTLLAMAEAHHHAQAPAQALGAAGGLLMQRVQRIVDVPVTRQGTQMPAMGTLLALAALLWLFKPSGENALLRDLGLPPLAASTVTIAVPTFAGLQFSVADLATVVQPLAPHRLAIFDPAPAIEQVAPAPIATPADAGRDDKLALRQDTAIAAAPSTFDATPALPAAAPDTLAPHAVTAPAPARAQPAVDASMNPLQATATHQVAPEYPRSARLGAVEGFVLLKYRVDASGRARDVQVEEAVPAGVFEKAARRALAQWRFAPETASGTAAYRQQFDFRLEGGDAPVDAEDCYIRTGSRLCRPAP